MSFVLKQIVPHGKNLILHLKCCFQKQKQAVFWKKKFGKKFILDKICSKYCIQPGHALMKFTAKAKKCFCKVGSKILPFSVWNQEHQ